jgi:methyl-accepting chemotaxis protein
MTRPRPRPTDPARQGAVPFSQSLHARLLLWFLLLSILPLAAVGAWIHQEVTDALRDRAFAQLVAIRDIKRHTLERQLDAIWRTDVRFLAALCAERGFGRALATWPHAPPSTDAGPPAPDDELAAFKGFIERLVARHGYLDALLIGPSGEIIFSLRSEDLAGSDLHAGPLRESNLAALFRHLRASPAGHARFADTAPFLGRPSLFVGAEIQHQGVGAGVLALQLPLQRIDDLMAERPGLGASGESYLVGADKRMRSDSYLQPEIRSVTASFKGSIAANGVDTQASRAALSGKSGTQTIVDYRGVSVLSAYTRLELPGLDWALLVEIDEAEALSPARALWITLLLIMGLITSATVLVALILSGRLARPIAALTRAATRVASGQLDHEVAVRAHGETGLLADAFQHMTARLRESQGRLEDYLNRSPAPFYAVDTELRLRFVNDRFARLARSSIDRSMGRPCHEVFPTRACHSEDCLARRAMQSGEVEEGQNVLFDEQGTPVHVVAAPVRDAEGAVSGAVLYLTDVSSLQRTLDRLSAVLGDARDAGARTARGARQLISVTSELSASAREQAAATSESGATVNEVAAIAEQSSERARQVAASSARCLDAAREGQACTEETLKAMSDITRQTEAMARTTRQLGEQARRIGDIVSMVDDFADQTNLLAVNASVEASHAGEQGRGFAVVARAVRALADRSKQATVQVREVLGRIDATIQDASAVAEQGRRQAQAGAGLTERSREAMTLIHDQAAQMATAGQQIEASARQQVQGMDQITSAMDSITDGARQTEVSATQVRTTASDLHGVAEQLRETVDQEEET